MVSFPNAPFDESSHPKSTDQGWFDDDPPAPRSLSEIEQGLAQRAERWFEDVQAFVRRFLRTSSTVCAGDLRRWCASEEGSEPPDPNHHGVVWAKLANRKVIKNIDRRITSSWPSTKGRKVWLYGRGERFDA